jgi:trimeric autotransporter adhesin
MLTLLNRLSKYSIAILGFLAISLSYAQDERADNISILDVDANGEVDALTDGLLLLRSMFELTDDALVTGAVDSANCTECDAEGIDSYITSIKGTTYGGLTPVAGSINNLADTLVESDSIYLGNDPSGTTESAENNVAIGATALDAITTGDANIAVGHDALTNNTTGYQNTASGYRALRFNVDGIQNTAYGYEALSDNIGGGYGEGGENTAIGHQALKSNTTGFRNTAVGIGSLQATTMGDSNTAVGAIALAKCDGEDCEWNTAVGAQSLYSNTLGRSNTAIGRDALHYNITGSYNTASGAWALEDNITGNYNTAIGNNADVGSGDLTNATAIGHGAIVTASNTIQLGNTSVTNVKTSGAITAAQVSNTSDRRLKKDIVDTRYGLNTILELRPVDYQMKSNNLEQIGFIAQELRPIVPEAVSGIEGDLEKGETLGVAYTTLIPVLTKAIQEQQTRIENQQQSIEAQNKVIQQLQKDMKILMQK